MPVQIELNTVEVKGALEDAVIAALYEVAEELTSITKRNTRPVRKGRHNVKDSWRYNVDEQAKSATIGSPLEASYWEELGTGSHALNKDGRKGWWVYVEGNDTPRPYQQTYIHERRSGSDCGFYARKGTRCPRHGWYGSKPTAISCF